jgi:multidrug efflux pump
LLVSQVLTLYTTPVIFLTFDRMAARIAKWRAKDVVPETVPAQAS